MERATGREGRVILELCFYFPLTSSKGRSIMSALGPDGGEKVWGGIWAKSRELRRRNPVRLELVKRKKGET